MIATAIATAIATGVYYGGLRGPAGATGAMLTLQTLSTGRIIANLGGWCGGLLTLVIPADRADRPGFLLTGLLYIYR